nr:MAG TPA: hypothetical protein [Bacteriophage sp.]
MQIWFLPHIDILCDDVDYRNRTALSILYNTTL